MTTLCRVDYTPARSESQVIGFVQAGRHWVQQLSCGHTEAVKARHLRNSWALSESGRAQRIGRRVTCRECGRAGE